MKDYNELAELKDKGLLFFSLFFNGLSIMSKADVSFTLGVIVSILAIVNYILQIRKNSK